MNIQKNRCCIFSDSLTSSFSPSRGTCRVWSDRVGQVQAVSSEWMLSLGLEDSEALVNWPGNGGYFLWQPEFPTDLVLYLMCMEFLPGGSEMEVSQRSLLVYKRRLARGGSGGVKRGMALSMVAEGVPGHARSCNPYPFSKLSLSLFLCCRPQLLPT